MLGEQARSAGVRKARGRRAQDARQAGSERHCSCDTAGPGCDTAGPRATIQPLCAHLGVPGCPVGQLGAYAPDSVFRLGF